MTAADNTVTYKWDKFADFVGLSHLENGPDLSNQSAVIAALSTPPTNFQPASDGSNVSKYLAVKLAAENFVAAQMPNTQATKIVRIEPFGASFLNADSVSQNENSFVALPYLERGAANATAFSDLSNFKTNSGLDESGHFSIRQTINGKVTNDNPATGSVYLMTYQLGGHIDQNYQALITIPEGASPLSPKPLMLFAHGGDAGLAFKEIATLLQGNLAKFIVAAPVYPGEPICAVDFSEGSASNNYARSCVDSAGNVTSPVIEPLGTKSPLLGDVNALLALQYGIWKLDTKQMSPVSGLNPFDKGIIPFYGNMSSIGIQTIGVADSRGGATLMAAIGRTGMLMSLGKVKYPIFSGASLLYSPSSLLVGQFRFLSQVMMNGNVPSYLNALPMIPELTHSFDAYRGAETNSANETNELQNLVGFIAASDVSYLAPYLSAATKNWNEYVSYYPILVSAPGSIIFLHGTPRSHAQSGWDAPNALKIQWSLLVNLSLQNRLWTKCLPMFIRLLKITLFLNPKHWRSALKCFLLNLTRPIITHHAL